MEMDSDHEEMTDPPRMDSTSSSTAARCGEETNNRIEPRNEDESAEQIFKEQETNRVTPPPPLARASESNHGQQLIWRRLNHEVTNTARGKRRNPNSHGQQQHKESSPSEPASVPTNLTEEVSALHTFDTSDCSDDHRTPPPPPPPMRRVFKQEGQEIDETDSSATSSSSDVPPPLPLLPSPPIRGAGVCATDDEAAIRPNALQSAPSRDDTIATTASMIRESCESDFVPEMGVDLDALMDEMLNTSTVAAKPQRALVNEGQQQLGKDQQAEGKKGADDKKYTNEKECAETFTDKEAAIYDSPGDPAKKKSISAPSNHSGSEAVSELTDDELPAIITPPLRRQGSTSTPGAYRAGGSNGNNPTEPLPPPPPLSVSSSHSVTHSATRTMTRQTSTRVSRRLVRTFSYDSVDDSCRTPVTATLVTDNDEQQRSPMRREQPLVVAHAEPLVKAAAQRKRRCILAWLFLVAVLASAVAGIAAAWVQNERLLQPIASSHDDKLPDEEDEIPEELPLPSAVNITDINQDIGMQSSSHTVMWGLVATCRDDSFLSRYALDLQCGGELRILHAENADCFPRMVDEEANLTDSSRVSCLIRGKPNQIVLEDGLLFYQDVTASVIFECVGRTLIDHSATANIPPMEILDCSNEQHVLENRTRSLRASVPVATHKAPSLSQARSRALQEVLVGGGAASYMTVGRFCSEQGDWILWHEWYACEKGERFFFSQVTGVYNSEVPQVDNWVSGTGGVVLSTFLQAINPGGDRRLRRRLQDNMGEVPFGALVNAIGAQSFCYSKQGCRSEEEACVPGVNCTGCSVNTDELIMSDYDPRSSCRWTRGGPDISEMRRKVADELKPEELVDRIAREI